ncbi:MAG: hypothetical protein LBC97_07035 [Bifidobacteriaceae bacterium]|jgi:hypothetical protein|nr:hypothetical protein [Bifidobacteriaceae bacterium]
MNSGRAVVLAVALLVLVTACTGPVSVDAPVSTDTGGSAVVLGTVELPIARTDSPSPVELPFAPYYEAARRVVAVARDVEQAAWDDVYRAQQQIIAKCMKESGFTYFPLEPTPPAEASEDVYGPYALTGDTLGDVPVLPNTLDETLKVGYGVLSMGEYTGAFEPGPLEGEAENSEYYESLSDSARQAYDLALVGLTEEDEAGATPIAGNCYERAYAQVPDAASVDVSFLEPLIAMGRTTGASDVGFGGSEDSSVVSEAEDVKSVDDLPEIVELKREFKDCLINGEMGEVFSKYLVDVKYAVPRTAFEVAVSTGPDGELFIMEVGRTYYGEDIPEVQQSLVGSQAERDIAAADFVCRQETGYVERYAAALKDRQTEFISEHQAELDRMEESMQRFLAEHS